MQCVKKRIVFALTAFVILTLFLCMLTLSFSPNIPDTPAPSHQDIIQLKKKLLQSNPFTVQKNGLRTVSISEKNANQITQIFLSSLLSNVSPGLSTRNIPTNIQFHNGYATVAASPMISIFSTNWYFNIRFAISFDFTTSNSKFTVTDMHIGLLPIPDALLSLLYPKIETLLTEKKPAYTKLMASIRKISISKQRISVVYHWDRHFASHAKDMSKDILLSTNQQKLIGIYYHQLAKIPRFYLRIPTDINKVIQPLFHFTKQRIRQGNNPVEENRATLLTLGIFASGIRISRIIKTENNQYLRHLPYGRLLLNGRKDLMRHFLISAALTVSSNKLLADTIGLSKEITDSDGGSGFSFADLLADRAGTAFAKFAISPDTARIFTEKISRSDISSADYMPQHLGLPEGISELQFKKTYGNIKSKQYQAMEEKIFRRINRLAIYKVSLP